VTAVDPKALEPYLRLLTLVAFATRRTPVLPMMQCDAPGQTWVDARVDPRTGMPRHLSYRAHRDRPRPCGWAIHEIGGEQLPEPACVQRPPEGCFLAFATPNELSPHLPSGYWNGTARLRCRGSHLSLERCLRVPTIDILRPERDTQPMVTMALQANLSREPSRLAAESLLRLTSRFALPRHDPISGERRRALLLQTPAPADLHAEPVLRLSGLFDQALTELGNAIARRASPGSSVEKRDGFMKEAIASPLLRKEWSKCLRRMVRANKCNAVC
jgi:hypothetical protein